MDIFRFIKWWWNLRNTGEKSVLFIFTSIIFLIPNIWIFGFIAFQLFMAGCLLGILVFFAYQIWKGIANQWYQFQLEREKEAQRIIYRLSGVMPSDDRELTLIERIRKYSKVKS